MRLATFNDGNFTGDLIADYMQITDILIQAGYDPVKITVSDEEAAVIAIRRWTDKVELALIKQDGVWQLEE